MNEANFCCLSSDGKGCPPNIDTSKNSQNQKDNCEFYQGNIFANMTPQEIIIAAVTFAVIISRGKSKIELQALVNFMEAVTLNLTTMLEQRDLGNSVGEDVWFPIL